MLPHDVAKTASIRPPLDVHLHGDVLLSWKHRLGYLALLGVAGLLGLSYALSGQADFRAAPGAVASVHQTWETSCQVCHVDFTPISNNSWPAPFLGSPASSSHRCESCHGGPAHHVGQHPDLNCASCHREHRGRDASLTSLPDSDCTQCHRDLNEHGGDGKFQAAVSRFSVAGHPAFRSIRADPGKLKFNHRLHMSAGMAIGPGGGVIQTLGKIPEPMRKRYLDQQSEKDDEAPVQLQCAACHQLNAVDPGRDAALNPRAGGAYMTPIAFEQHCQACHPLNAGAVVLSHRWQPKELHALLADFFTAQAARAQPGFFEKKAVSPLPGKVPDLLPPSLRKMIAGQVEHAERDLYLGNRLCAECHYFEGKSVAEAIQPGAAPDLRVVSPKVPAVWLKHARFNHKSHRATQCADCHAEATASTVHTDVLIPDRELCVKCHAPGTSQGTGGARFQCTSCHLYHSADHHLPKPGVLKEDHLP